MNLPGGNDAVRLSFYVLPNTPFKCPIPSRTYWSMFKISGTLLTFILAMKLYPEVQAKAKAELDHVLGDRLPTMADKDSLPYLNAVLLKILRWRPVSAIGALRF